MIFMLRITGEIMLGFLHFGPWVGAVVLAVIMVFAIVARRRPAVRPGGFGSRYAVVLMTLGALGVPLLMLVWGLHFWPEKGRGAHEAFAMGGLYVLGIFELALSLAIVWRGRGTILAGVAASAALWWAASALFTATMAVTNTWL